MVNVPLLDLRAQYATIRDEVDEAIRRVVESQYFILGPEVKAFENEIAGVCGVKRAIGVSSGTDALLVALMALDVRPGDEVVTTPFTFFATAGVIARLGAIPVFVDIEPQSFNIDPDLLACAIGPRAKAVVPVHLYGRCVDPAVYRIAADAGVPVIEDAAQAIGATDPQGRTAGSIGFGACFSFFPTKNLGGFGDAGLVTTGDDAFADLVEALRVHGGEQRYYHPRVGGNFRLDALQAAVLRVKLKRLPEWNAARRRNADRYRELFAGAGLEDRITPPADLEGHIYHQFVIRAQDRDGLRDHLQRSGIASEVYYPLPLHLQECFAGLGHAAGDFPVAETAAREVLALPIHPELTDVQLEAVTGAIAAYYHGS
jgi:dTDP-4-amino-4,6-dideoxygalactose transaminase